MKINNEKTKIKDFDKQGNNISKIIEQMNDLYKDTNYNKILLEAQKTHNQLEKVNLIPISLSEQLMDLSTAVSSVLENNRFDYLNYISKEISNKSNFLYIADKLNYDICKDISLYTTNISETVAKLNDLPSLKIPEYIRIPDSKIKELYNDESLVNEVTYDTDYNNESVVRILDTSGNKRKLKEQKDYKTLKSFLPEITNEDCSAFLEFLVNFPMLGVKHNVGEMIFSELETKYEKYCITIESDTTFYRCRIEEDSCSILTPREMFAPPFDKTNENRFSNKGVSHLYLTSSSKIAKAEIGYTMGKVKNINTIQIKNNDSFNLINLDKDMGATFAFCLFPCSKFTIPSQAYLISNYISQCLYFIKKHNRRNIDGIRYPSVRCNDNDKEYCYVLFNKHYDDFNNCKFVK